MDKGQLSFPALTTALKAAAEATRLRILALIAESELTVSDLTEILRQSQPRLSRHLRLLAEAGWSNGFARARGRSSGSPSVAARPISRARWWSGSTPTIRSSPATASGSPPCGRRAPPRRRITFAAMPRNGTASASSTSPTPRSRPPSAPRLPTSRSVRCSISAPAPAACWNCSPPMPNAASASICRSTCWRWRAHGWTAPA